MTPETLKLIMEQRKESAKVFAKTIHVSRNMVGEYLSGKRPIPHKVAAAATLLHKGIEVM